MKKYYFFDGTTQHGPFTFEELKAKQITAQTSVWFNPMPQWKPAREIDELKNLFSATAPSSTPNAASVPNQEDWNNKLYYFLDNTGKQNGPLRLSDLKGQNISAQTSIWYDPLPKWTTVGEIPSLKDIINKLSAVPSPVSTLSVAPKEENWSNKQFYFADSTGTQHGPFKLNQLEGKNITDKTGIWYDPLPKWTTAGEIPALKDIINKTAAVPSSVTSSVASPKEEDWVNKMYFLIDSTGKQNGPFKLNQLEGKNISAQTAIWYDPLPKWTTAEEIPALKNIIDKTAAVLKEGEWSNKLFFITDETGAQQGPYKLEQLKEKNITAETPIWYNPLPKWTTSGEIPALKDIINKPAAGS